jgi:hypothetical protein
VDDACGAAKVPAAGVRHRQLYRRRERLAAVEAASLLALIAREVDLVDEHHVRALAELHARDLPAAEARR